MSKLREILEGKIPDEKLQALILYESQLNALNRVVEITSEDFVAVLNDLNSDQENQLKRRTLVRTLFAMLEGVIYVLKQKVVLEHKNGKCELSEAEYAVLAEESYDLKDNGQIRTSQKFIRLETNIKFTYSIFARKLLGKKLKLDTSGSDWENIRQSIRVRNRLMHPKSEEDLQVNDTELVFIKASAKWFEKQFTQLLDELRKVIEQSIKNSLRE